MQTLDTSWKPSARSELGVVELGRVEQAAVERRTISRAGQRVHRRAHAGEDVDRQPHGAELAGPLKSSRLGDRLLEPAQRLRGHRGRRGRTPRRGSGCGRSPPATPCRRRTVCQAGGMFGVHAPGRPRAPAARAPSSCRTSKQSRRGRRRGVPLLTASIRSNALTTAPAGSTSILSSPPDMSLTFLAKSPANSWKMSLVGQVLCQRIVTEPCALEPMAGKPIAAGHPRQRRRTAHELAS